MQWPKSFYVIEKKSSGSYNWEMSGHSEDILKAEKMWTDNLSESHSYGEPGTEYRLAEAVHYFPFDVKTYVMYKILGYHCK